MNVTVGTTYLSNNSCFPGQLFHVTAYEHKERFGQDNVLVTYERWAIPLLGTVPYKIETTKSWLTTNSECFLGSSMPDDIQLEFDGMRRAVTVTESMIPW
jgi:hypothetical protein